VTAQLAARVAWVVVAYLLGSVCFGPIAAARAGVNLRAVGSGNVGATNVSRALGRRAGYVVMGLDALKGFAPTLGAALTLGPGDPWTAAAGVAAVIGHVLPIWFRFRGGKGAATACGVLLAAAPIAGFAAVVTFIVLKVLSGRASVGSLAASLVGIAGAAATSGMGTTTHLAIALAGIVFVRHIDNLRRLARGEEPRA
jgi:glycerol-3-phosphate acyltransferase PlsY